MKDLYLNQYVYFCSAYNDISHILSFLITNNKNTTNLIVVVNNLEIVQFFKDLQIPNTNVVFISTRLKSFFNPIHWIKEYFYLKKIRLHFIESIQHSEIFFFASFYDLLTCSLVNSLRNENTVTLSIPVDNDFIPLWNNHFINIALSKLYRVKINSFLHFNNVVHGINLIYLYKYFNQRIASTYHDLEIARKNFKLRCSNNSFILILDNGEKHYLELINNFYQSLESIYSFLNRNNKILIKGHPRGGLTEIALQFSFTSIDKYIPAEFIDLDNCTCAIGLDSIALVNISHYVKTISIIDLMEYKDHKIKKLYKDYLLHESNAILFPRNFSELKNLF